MIIETFLIELIETHTLNFANWANWNPHLKKKKKMLIETFKPMIIDEMRLHTKSLKLYLLDD